MPGRLAEDGRFIRRTSNVRFVPEGIFDSCQGQSHENAGGAGFTRNDIAPSSNGSPDSVLPSSTRRLLVEGQPKILKHRLGPVENEPLEHLRPLAHQIHGHQPVLDELDQVEWFADHLDEHLAIDLNRLDGGHAAHRHGPERVRVEIAEIKPVGPRLVEGGVEPPDFRDCMNFPGIVVPAVHPEHHGVHHLAQTTAIRQFPRCVEAEEMGEITPLHLPPAELIKNEFVTHDGVALERLRPGFS